MIDDYTTCQVFLYLKIKSHSKLLEINISAELPQSYPCNPGSTGPVEFLFSIARKIFAPKDIGYLISTLKN